MEANHFTILWWFCHTLTWISHGCTCVPHPEPPPTSIPIPSLWVIPVHQSWAPCLMQETFLLKKKFKKKENIISYNLNCYCHFLYLQFFFLFSYFFSSTSLLLSTHLSPPSCMCMLSHVTPWTAARQADLSMDFSRQEYWNESPFPSPGTVTFLTDTSGCKCR